MFENEWESRRQHPGRDQKAVRPEGAWHLGGRGQRSRSRLEVMCVSAQPHSECTPSETVLFLILASSLQG